MECENIVFNKKRRFGFSVHYSFIIMFVASFFVGLANVLFCYFLCLCIHEFCHAIVAKKLGYKIGKVKLLATGAVLEAESDEFSYVDEIKIAISGPLFNLFFSFILIVLWWIFPVVYNFTMDLCVINLAIFAFNMLPIFPLDGGRILLAFLSKNIERSRAVKIVKAITILLSSMIFLIFILSLFHSPNFNLGIIGITLFLGGIVEDKNASYKKTYFFNRKKARLAKRGVEVRYVCVSEKNQNSNLIKMLNARYYTIFILVDSNFNKVRVVEERELFVV